MMHLPEMLRTVSRTFATSIERLPSALREEVMVSYLLLRVSDCLEDNDVLNDKHKAELLRLWAEILNKNTRVESLTREIAHLDKEDPEVYVAQQADQILDALELLPQETQEIIIHHVVQSSLGMARWQEHGSYVNTEDEMDDYMHQVAGRVGYLLTDLFSNYSPSFQKRADLLRPLARHFGLALQTVNIIRGLRKDYERGWVFVPRTFYESVGLTRDSLFDQENLEQALHVTTLLVNKAETHLQHGLEYVLHIPQFFHGIRLACMWPLFFAKKTLTLSQNNAQVILGESKITRNEVMKIIRQTTIMGWSNQWLKSYYQHLEIAEPVPIRVSP